MNSNVRRPSLEALYREVDLYLPAPKSQQPPRIGISANRKDGLSCIADTYVEAVVAAGGAPVLIPVITDLAALTAVVEGLDGLLMSGGGDLNPLYLQEEPIPQLQDVDTRRDEYDLILLRLAAARQLPVMGICRGHQLLNVAFGGSVYQDIYSQAGSSSDSFFSAAYAGDKSFPTGDSPNGTSLTDNSSPRKPHTGDSPNGKLTTGDSSTANPASKPFPFHTLLKHSQKMPREQVSHSVRLVAGPTRLRTLLPAGIDTLWVNSFHHQAVSALAPEFIPTAVAPDGINEGMEHPEKKIFSVQWHPEALASNGDEEMLALFRHLVECARLFGKAKALHERIITLDSHTDTPMIFPGRFDIGRKEGGKTNLPLMEEGRIDATFMVAYIPQGKRDEASLKAATAYAVNRLEEVRRQQELHPERMGIATSEADIRRLKRKGRKAICLGVENGYAIGKDLENLRMFRDLGVTYITLCHNGDNDLCDSARGQEEWHGLSPFGKEVVKEMNRLGLMVDVSHAAETTFYDVLQISTSPVIASHSAARALCNHPRNLTDDQLKALAEQGGVAQICLYKGFINEAAEQASLSDALRHIRHIVEVAGIDHVGIGSDFDGDGELIGCRATNELINLTVRLLEEGYTEEDIQKIWGGNLLRVLSAVQSSATK